MIRKLMCWLTLIILYCWGFYMAFGWFLYFEDYGFEIFFLFGMFANQLWNDFCVER